MKRILIASVIAVFAGGGAVASDSPDEPRLKVGSAEWKKAAAATVRLSIVGVVRTPGGKLTFHGVDGMALTDDEKRGIRGLTLTDDEKRAIRGNGVNGNLRVLSLATRGSGASESRIVIIQDGPLSAPVVVPVPDTGSAVYLIEQGKPRRLTGEGRLLPLTLELYQDNSNTIYRLDYPHDRIRFGGALSWWDSRTGK
jgi:hypothetical protein